MKNEKHEIEFISKALHEAINPNDSKTSLFPDHLILTMKEVAGESIASLMTAPIHKKYYSNNVATLIYKNTEDGGNQLAQAQLNALSLAVPLRKLAPTFYAAVKEFSFGVHLANDESHRNGVINGYDDLTLAGADRKLYFTLRQAYPAIRPEPTISDDSPAKPKRPLMKPF